MFFDWLSCYQDFDFELPIISDTGYAVYDFLDDELGQIRQSKINHEGSFSTSIQIHVKGNRLCFSGNPSRYNRLDNLFGFTTLEHLFAVYNHICDDLGLPHFTKCTHCGFTQKIQSDGSVKLVPIVNGAVITSLHITTNLAVGSLTAVDAYLRALSALPYRRSRGRLHADGKTVDWLSILGNARLIYPSVYDKGNELRIHTLPKLKRAFGVNSDQYQYIQSLIDYCNAYGVVRAEQKLNSPYLTQNNLQYYGLSDYSILTTLHNEFLNLDDKLQVSAMDINTITQTLINENICTNTKSANLTALCAINWMNGQTFDSSNSGQVRNYRARLRKIGIDICKPCNILTFSPVIVKQVIEIQKIELQPPSFYRHAVLPSHLRLVA